MGPVVGQSGALYWVTHGCPCWGPWGLITTCYSGPTCLPLMSMLVPHRAPDSKIPWATWMANEGRSHGPHMGCKWWGSWRLATSCLAGPTYLPLLMPIWAGMGPFYVCHHPASKFPWAPWGAYLCASRNIHITGDSKGHPNRSSVAKAGKYDETGSCKVIVFMPHRSHLKEVCCETTKRPGNWDTCLWQNYPHTYVLIL